MNIMVVVSHPDDEVLGFGGIIQRHNEAGDDVFVNFISEPWSERLKIQFSQFPIVAKKLGYVGKLDETILDDEHFKKNVATLERNIEKFKPDILYSCFGGDNHQDHEYMFKVLRIATRTWAPFFVKEINIGEILSSTEQSPKLPQFAFLPTLYVPLEKEHVEKKIECMKCYDYEIMDWPHPRSEKGIMNLAEKRGSECRSNYAEAFMVLRRIASPTKSDFGSKSVGQ